MVEFRWNNKRRDTISAARDISKEFTDGGSLLGAELLSLLEIQTYLAYKNKKKLFTSCVKQSSVFLLK